MELASEESESLSRRAIMHPVFNGSSQRLAVGLPVDASATAVLVTDASPESLTQARPLPLLSQRSARCH